MRIVGRQASTCEKALSSQWPASRICGSTWRNEPPNAAEIGEIAKDVDKLVELGANIYRDRDDGVSVAVVNDDWHRGHEVMQRLDELANVDDFLKRHRFVGMRDWRDNMTLSSERRPIPIQASDKLTESRKQVRTGVEAWVDQLIEDEDPRYQMLILSSSEKGTGKTMLELIVARALAWSGRSVHIVRGHEMFRRIRETFSGDSVRTEDVMRQYTDSDVLVIDDFGTHAGTDWELDTLSSIIDSRYDYERPIVATTNATEWGDLMRSHKSVAAKRAAERCASRFSEVGLWIPIPTEWPDMRRIARDLKDGGA